MLTRQGEQRLALVEEARRADMDRILSRFSLEQLHALEHLLQLLLDGINELISSRDSEQHLHGQVNSSLDRPT
jgi:hypothetical protein